MAKKKIALPKTQQEPFDVKVEIECSEVIMYKQTVMMRQSDYDKIKDLQDFEVHEIRNNEAYAILRNYIDPNDVYDTPNSEFTDVEINKID